MNTTATLLASVLLVTGQAAEQPAAGPGTAVKISNFVVTLIYDVRVPAREPGVLNAIDKERGQIVSKNDILGSVDDSDAQMRRVIAENELKSAETQAASDAALKAARATIGVAKAEYEGSLDIRSRSLNAVSEYELRRQKLTAERSEYEAEKAEVDFEVAQLTRGVRIAQLQAVENEIKRRQIESPIDGVIVERYHNAGEWAQAGEPIYRIVHMDRLRVEGMLHASKFMLGEIAGRPVKIEVTVTKDEDGTRRHVEEFAGRIDFVSPVVDPSGEFLVHAEFENPRKPNGQWRVRPGLDAEVTILLEPTTSARDSQ